MILEVLELGFKCGVVFLIQIAHFYRLGFAYDLFREGKILFELGVPLIVQICESTFAYLLPIGRTKSPLSENKKKNWILVCFKFFHSLCQ